MKRFQTLTLALLASCAAATDPSSDLIEQPLSAFCKTNAECTGRLSADGTNRPAICVREPTAHCVQLTSEDCSVVTGDYLDDRALVIASLLSTTGVQAATNLPRQQAAILAVEQLNAARASCSSSPTAASTAANSALSPVVMVSCDEAANLPRVASHLVTDLRVRAIVGPNLSQDVIDLTLGKPETSVPSAARAGIPLLTPTALAAAIAGLDDGDQTFVMVPNDAQRTALLELQINALEAELAAARGTSTIKLGIYHRRDATGQGTRAGLESLTINHDTLAAAIAAGTARDDAYDPASTNNAALVAAYAQLAPDIIVIVGAAEAIKFFVLPLEAAWPAGAPRPHYLATDATKIGDLLTAVTGNDDLRRRFRGTGIAASAESQPVLRAFQDAYGKRWTDASGNPQPATQFGMAQAYDAVHAIALASAARVPGVRAPTIASRLRLLATNPAPCASDASGLLAPCFAVTDAARTLDDNLARLRAHRVVTEIGAAGRLEWDPQGAKSSGTIEMWCIASAGGKPAFASSGLTYDIKTDTVAGAYTACSP